MAVVMYGDEPICTYMPGAILFFQPTVCCCALPRAEDATLVMREESCPEVKLLAKSFKLPPMLSMVRLQSLEQRNLPDGMVGRRRTVGRRIRMRGPLWRPKSPARLL